MDELLPFLRAFLFTQLVETPIYANLGPTSIARGASASALTHPIVWFVFFSARLPLVYETKLALAETFALVVEALVLMHGGIRPTRAFAVSFLANASSVIAGTLLRAATGYP